MHCFQNKSADRALMKRIMKQPPQCMSFTLTFPRLGKAFNYCKMIGLHARWWNDLVLSGDFILFHRVGNNASGVSPWWNYFLLSPLRFMQKVQFCWHDALINMHDILVKPPLRLALLDYYSLESSANCVSLGRNSTLLCQLKFYVTSSLLMTWNYNKWVWNLQWDCLEDNTRHFQVNNIDIRYIGAIYVGGMSHYWTKLGKKRCSCLAKIFAYKIKIWRQIKKPNVQSLMDNRSYIQCVIN